MNNKSGQGAWEMSPPRALPQGRIQESEKLLNNKQANKQTNPIYMLPYGTLLFGLGLNYQESKSKCCKISARFSQDSASQVISVLSRGLPHIQYEHKERGGGYNANRAQGGTP